MQQERGKKTKYDGLELSIEDTDPKKARDMVSAARGKIEEIAQKIRGLSSNRPLGMNDRDFRISVAGAQEKTALLKIKNKIFI